MNNDFLIRLYWACSDEEMSFVSGLNLGELYARSEETSNADLLFYEKLSAAGLPKDERVLLEGLSSSACTAYEQQGFINGFRLGMKLAAEVRGEGLRFVESPP